MRTTLFATSLLLAVSLLPVPLRGEAANACEQAPLVEPSELVDFIHPGVRVQRAKPDGLLCEPKPGSDCSLGFILQHTDTHKLWATGAGHCFNTELTPGDGQLFYAYHPDFGAWGRVAWSRASRTPDMAPVDIALIEIFPWAQDNVNASVPVFGGPEGTTHASDPYTPNSPVGHYGMPWVPSSPVGLARAGLLINWTASHFLCTCAVSHGDSGSPFIDISTGKALGLAYASEPDVYIVGITPPSEVNGTATIKHWGPLFETQLALIHAQNDDWKKLVLDEEPLSAFGQALKTGEAALG